MTVQAAYRDEAHHATDVMDAAILRNTRRATIRRFASGTPWYVESEGIALEAITGPVIWSVGYERLFQEQSPIRPDVPWDRLLSRAHPPRGGWASVSQTPLNILPTTVRTSGCRSPRSSFISILTR
jgi:hypothetical protein